MVNITPIFFCQQTISVKITNNSRNIPKIKKNKTKLGWLRQMLRNQRHSWRRYLCRQNRLQETDGQAQPEGENDPGDSDPQIAQACQYRAISQLLRRYHQRLHHFGTVQTAIDDGIA